MFFLPYNDDVHARDVDCKPPPEKIRGITRFLFRYIDIYVTFIMMLHEDISFCIGMKREHYEAEI